jgi:hypothetical protein
MGPAWYCLPNTAQMDPEQAQLQAIPPAVSANCTLCHCKRCQVTFQIAQRQPSELRLARLQLIHSTTLAAYPQPSTCGTVLDHGCSSSGRDA